MYQNNAEFLQKYVTLKYLICVFCVVYSHYIWALTKTAEFQMMRNKICGDIINRKFSFGYYKDFSYPFMVKNALCHAHNYNLKKFLAQGLTYKFMSQEGMFM